MVESPPADAQDTGSCPGLGRSHMPWSGWACVRPEPVLHNGRGPRTAMKSGPRLPQLEKALAQKRRPNTAKINKLINKLLPPTTTTTTKIIKCVEKKQGSLVGRRLFLAPGQEGVEYSM